LGNLSQATKDKITSIQIRNPKDIAITVLALKDPIKLTLPKLKHLKFDIYEGLTTVINSMEYAEMNLETLEFGKIDDDFPPCDLNDIQTTIVSVNLPKTKKLILNNTKLNTSLIKRINAKTVIVRSNATSLAEYHLMGLMYVHSYADFPKTAPTEELIFESTAANFSKKDAENICRNIFISFRLPMDEDAEQDDFPNLKRVKIISLKLGREYSVMYEP
jgi:hypothetical protein